MTQRILRSSGGHISVAWGIACELRNAIGAARFTSWPADILTAREKKLLNRAMRKLEEAENEVCRLQSSLSKRSKSEGVDSPDRPTARRLNP